VDTSQGGERDFELHNEASVTQIKRFLWCGDGRYPPSLCQPWEGVARIAHAPQAFRKPSE